ncbi:hypothetical protein [Halorubrum sp. ASP1]|uniref:hypothetical protein n=1 Tax=Halorubrum sp. ASP1 TaxID=2518114 RepID=UPI00130538CE|nr:hypothetical protein [Halorubrum sp. ASP1]
MSSNEKEAVGTARGRCEDPMEVWNVVETALHDLTDEEGYGDGSYPADVEVEIRVE